MILVRQREAVPVARQSRQNAAVLEVQTRGDEGLFEFAPLSGRIRCQLLLLIGRKRMDGANQLDHGFLDAMIRRRQFQCAIERVEVVPELLTEGMDRVVGKGMVAHACRRVLRSAA